MIKKFKKSIIPNLDIITLYSIIIYNISLTIRDCWIYGYDSLLLIKFRWIIGLLLYMLFYIIKIQIS